MNLTFSELPSPPSHDGLGRGNGLKKRLRFLLSFNSYVYFDTVSGSG